MSTAVSVVLSLFPFFFLIILNFLIFHTIKKKTILTASSRQQQRDVFVATILILIVMLYAVCHSIKTAINVFELLSIITGKDEQKAIHDNS